MSSIFISHSSADNKISEEIKDWLVQKGHQSVFLDFDPDHGIPSGSNWEKELYKKIKECRAVIVVCSKSSMKSNWCFMEITYSRALGKRIFPVKVDNCEVSDVLRDSQITDLTTNKDEGYERLWQGMLASGLDPTDSFQFDSSRSPYPGLLSFQEEDAAIFFGRDQEISELCDLMSRLYRIKNGGLIVVLGASGTGKSSLVRAGVLPRIKKDAQRWIVIDPFRPKNNPARGLSQSLSRAFDRYGIKKSQSQIYAQIVSGFKETIAHKGLSKEFDDSSGVEASYNETDIRQKIKELEELLAIDHNSQLQRVLRILKELVIKSPQKKHTGPLDKKPTPTSENPINQLVKELIHYSGHEEAVVLITIDQFEEIFGKGDEDSNHRFMIMLRDAFEHAENRCAVLLTMRSDFLEPFQKAEALLDVQFDNISLGPLSTEGITSIIEKPAVLANIEIEPGLTETMVTDAIKNNSLPLLAFTLRELYERFGQDGILGINEYHASLGGLGGSIARVADSTLATRVLNTEQQIHLKNAFLGMAELNDQGEFVRRAILWNEVNPEIHQVIQDFIDARLLVSYGDDNKVFVEVAHEALFKSWKRYAVWLEENREFITWRKRIQDSTTEWDQNDRDQSLLYRGANLIRAKDMMEKYPNALVNMEMEQDFFNNSINLESRELKSISRRRTMILTGLSVGLLAISFLAFLNARESNKNKQLFDKLSVQVDSTRTATYVTHIQKGRALMTDTSYSAAIVEFNNALELIPNDSIAQALKTFSLAQLDKKEKYDLLMTLGDSLYGEGPQYYIDALEYYREAEKLNFSNYAKHRVDRTNSQLAGAKIEFERKGDIFLEVKGYQFALWNYERALRINPEDQELQQKVSLCQTLING